MSASGLYEKYEKLVDKKLVTEDFLQQEIQMRLELKKKEHELKMQSLQLDIELTKKTNRL